MGRLVESGRSGGTRAVDNRRYKRVYPETLGSRMNSRITTPLVSVIVPAYNRPSQLAEALDSLCAQTQQPHEVVVYDDGSSDDLQAVVSRFSSSLCIRYLRGTGSGSAAFPRNQAAAVSTGNWLAFLDSDDGWYPTKIEKLHRYISTGVDVIYHPLKIIRSRPRTVLDRLSITGTDCGADPLRHIALINNPIPTSGAAVRALAYQAAGGFCTEQPLAEDFDLWWRIAQGGGRFVFVPEVLGWYRISPDAISTASVRNAQAISAVYERNRSSLPYSWTQASTAAMHLALAREMLAIQRPDLARHHLLLAKPLSTPSQRWKRLAAYLFSWTLAPRVHR